MFRCHNGQKYSARHSSEFWPNSTGNFVRRPHAGPVRVQRISGTHWITHVVWGSLADGNLFFLIYGTGGFSSFIICFFLLVRLYFNGGRIGAGYVEEANTIANQNDQLTLQSTLNLEKGDQVWVVIDSILSGVSLFDSGAHYTHFTGFLLEEKIVASIWWFCFNYQLFSTTEWKKNFFL